MSRLQKVTHVSDEIGRSWPPFCSRQLAVTERPWVAPLEQASHQPGFGVPRAACCFWSR